MIWSSFPIYASSVWDRMIASPEAMSKHAVVTQLPLDQFECPAACDLETLLNTRTGFRDTTLIGLPYCVNRIVNFGLPDFTRPPAR